MPSPNPLRRGSRGWGGLIRHIHAAVAANGATMVTWFVGWLMRQLTIKINYSYVDKATVAQCREFFNLFGTNLVKLNVAGYVEQRFSVLYFRCQPGKLHTPRRLIPNPRPAPIIAPRRSPRTANPNVVLANPNVIPALLVSRTYVLSLLKEGCVIEIFPGGTVGYPAQPGLTWRNQFLLVTQPKQD